MRTILRTSSVLGKDTALTESEQEVLENEKDGSGNIEIEAYVEGDIDNVSYYAQARELIVSRYKQEIPRLTIVCGE